MLPDNKVIITVAVNGGMQQDRDGCVVPKQPAEIGEAARLSYGIQPSSAVTIDIIGDYTHQGGRGGGATVVKRCGTQVCFYVDKWTSLSDQPGAYAPLAPQSRRGIYPAMSWVMVRSRRLELPRPFGHNDLNVARLPIPPRPHIKRETGGAGALVGGGP